MRRDIKERVCLVWVDPGVMIPLMVLVSVAYYLTR